MKKLQPGVLAADVCLPCSPRSIGMRQYVLTGTLNRIEDEEIVARLLSFSQWNDQWVGVSLERLCQMFDEERQARQAHNDTLEQYRQAYAEYQGELQAYREKLFRTWGVSWFFTDMPKKPPEPVWEGSWSILQIYGPQAVMRSLYDLIDAGMIQCIDEDEESGEKNIFVPLPKLVLRIMAVQGIPAAA